MKELKEIAATTRALEAQLSQARRQFGAGVPADRVAFFWVSAIQPRLTPAPAWARTCAK